MSTYTNLDWWNYQCQYQYQPNTYYPSQPVYQGYQDQCPTMPVRDNMTPPITYTDVGTYPVSYTPPSDYNNWSAQSHVQFAPTPPVSSTSSSPHLLPTSPVILHDCTSSSATSPTLPDVTVQNDQNVKISLTNSDIWNEYAGENNEMRVTADGRNLFPVLNFKVSGLQPKSFYRASLHFEPVDGALLRFDRRQSKWIRDPKMKGQRAMKTEPVFSKKMTGQQMMETLDWSRVKLYNVGNPKKTNEGKGRKNKLNKKYTDLMVRVELKYQYIPVLTILNDDNEMMSYQVFCSSYPESQFIAVSAYCNPIIIAMKRNNTYSKYKTTDK